MGKPSVTITGLDAINKAFDAMDPWQLNPILKEGLKAAADIVAQEARRNAPTKTGVLRKGIRVKAGKNRKDYRSMIVSLGKKHFAGDQFYGAFQEFGWKSGKRGRRKGANNDNRKQNPGLHFLEKAFEAKAAEAQAAMVAIWQQRIKEAAGL